MQKTKIVMLDDWENYFSSQLDCSSFKDKIDITIHQKTLKGKELHQAIIDAEVIILLRERTAVDREFIAKAPKLKQIICTGNQVRNLDSEAVQEAGIKLSFAKGGDSKSTTAELTWTLILSAYKQLDKLRISPAQRQWRQQDKAHEVFIPTMLKGKQLGIIGLGSIGQKVAAVAKAFGMEVACWSPNMNPKRAAEHGAKALSLEELLSTSDIVSIHLVLSENTHHILNADNLNSLKKGAVLVNTSRAEIIDPEALLTTLQNGSLGYYASDVFEQEPLPSEHPLYSLDNVLMTAHFGFVAEEVYRLFADNIRKELIDYLG